MKLPAKCVVTTLCIALSACTTNPTTGEREANKTAYGAAIGAAVGALIGVATGDDADERRKHALIGAGVGVLAGTAVGAYMDAQEEKLRRELAESDVRVDRMEDDIVLSMPGGITFDVNQAELKPAFYNTLSQVASVLTEYDQTLVDINGHTDSTGAADYNQGLSERRALSVANYLAAQGVSQTRVSSAGYGSDYPVADNASADGRQKNRRVELVLKPLTEE